MPDATPAPEPTKDHMQDALDFFAMLRRWNRTEDAGALARLLSRREREAVEKERLNIIKSTIINLMDAGLLRREDVLSLLREEAPK